MLSHAATVQQKSSPGSVRKKTSREKELPQTFTNWAVTQWLQREIPLSQQEIPLSQPDCTLQQLTADLSRLELPPVQLSRSFARTP